MTTIMTGLTSQEYQFDGRSLRASLAANGEPMFVAKDVCEALGIEQHRDAVSRLDDDERGSVVVDTLGGSQAVAAVTESGLYALVFQSRKPEARRFRKWVTSEVLPALRREGVYRVAGHPARLPVEKLKLRLEAAELKARAKALEVTADRLQLPEAPADYLTIGQYLGERGIDQRHPGFLRLCAMLGNAMRGKPHGWTRGPDRKPRRCFAPAVFESLGELTAEV